MQRVVHSIGATFKSAGGATTRRDWARRWRSTRCFQWLPLLVFAVMLVGLFYGPEAAQGRVAEQMKGIMGDEPAQALQSLIASFHRSGGSPWATALSTAASAVRGVGRADRVASGAEPDLEGASQADRLVVADHSHPRS